MNPFDVLKNFQDIQSKMSDFQSTVQKIHATGTAGGDMVRIEINGLMEVSAITIAPEIVNPDDIGMLQDLLSAAFSAAVTKVKEKMREEMSQLTGGLNLPPELMGM